jgi:hypothetical protein
MTSGNYSPIGSTITDSVTGIIYTNTNTNGLTWTSTSTSVTIEHAFTGAGTFSYAHNLGTSYPLMTCYVNSGSVAYSASNPDVNDIAITVPAAADITCTFGI